MKSWCGSSARQALRLVQAQTETGWASRVGEAEHVRREAEAIVAAGLPELGPAAIAVPSSEAGALDEKPVMSGVAWAEHHLHVARASGDPDALVEAEQRLVDAKAEAEEQAEAQAWAAAAMAVEMEAVTSASSSPVIAAASPHQHAARESVPSACEPRDGPAVRASRRPSVGWASTSTWARSWSLGLGTLLFDGISSLVLLCLWSQRICAVVVQMFKPFQPAAASLPNDSTESALALLTTMFFKRIDSDCDGVLSSGELDTVGGRAIFTTTLTWMHAYPRVIQPLVDLPVIACNGDVLNLEETVAATPAQVGWFLIPLVAMLVINGKLRDPGLVAGLVVVAGTWRAITRLVTAYWPIYLLWLAVLGLRAWIKGPNRAGINGSTKFRSQTPTKGSSGTVDLHDDYSSARPTWIPNSRHLGWVLGVIGLIELRLGSLEQAVQVGWLLFPLVVGLAAAGKLRDPGLIAGLVVVAGMSGSSISLPLAYVPIFLLWLAVVGLGAYSNYHKTAPSNKQMLDVAHNAASGNRKGAHAKTLGLLGSVWLQDESKRKATAIIGVFEICALATCQAWVASGLRGAFQTATSIADQRTNLWCYAIWHSSFVVHWSIMLFFLIRAVYLDPKGEDFTLSGLMARRCNFRNWTWVLSIPIGAGLLASTVGGIIRPAYATLYMPTYLCVVVYKNDTHRRDHISAALTLFLLVFVVCVDTAMGLSSTSGGFIYNCSLVVALFPAIMYNHHLARMFIDMEDASEVEEHVYSTKLPGNQRRRRRSSIGIVFGLSNPAPLQAAVPAQPILAVGATEKHAAASLRPSNSRVNSSIVTWIARSRHLGWVAAVAGVAMAGGLLCLHLTSLEIGWFFIPLVVVLAAAGKLTDPGLIASLVVAAGMSGSSISLTAPVKLLFDGSLDRVAEMSGPIMEYAQAELEALELPQVEDLPAIVMQPLLFAEGVPIMWGVLWSLLVLLGKTQSGGDPGLVAGLVVVAGTWRAITRLVTAYWPIYLLWLAVLGLRAWKSRRGSSRPSSSSASYKTKAPSKVATSDPGIEILAGDPKIEILAGDLGCALKRTLEETDEAKEARAHGSGSPGWTACSGHLVESAKEVDGLADFKAAPAEPAAESEPAVESEPAAEPLEEPAAESEPAAEPAAEPLADPPAEEEPVAAKEEEAASPRSPRQWQEGFW